MCLLEIWSNNSPSKVSFLWFWRLLAHMVPSGSQRVRTGRVLDEKGTKKLEIWSLMVSKKRCPERLTCMFYNHSFLSCQDNFQKIRQYFPDVFYLLPANARPVIDQARGENLRWGWPTRAEINRQGHSIIEKYQIFRHFLDQWSNFDICMPNII